MTSLTIGLRQPAGAPRSAHIRHTAVAALARHHTGVVGVDRRAHCATQALGVRPRMAAVAGCAIADIIETLTAVRIHNPCMVSVYGGREGGDAFHTCSGQGIGAVTGGA